MSEATNQVSVILAAPTLDTILQKMYPVFSADSGRFRVASIAANWPDLLRNTQTMKADVVLLEADVASTPQELAQFLATLSGVAVVVLPPGWAQAEGTIRAVDKVREVFIGPHVNYAEIAHKVYSAAVTERALHQSAAPGIFEEGVALTTQESIPPFAFLPDLDGDVVLGHLVSTETGDLTRAQVRLSQERMFHTVFAGNTGYGKSVAAERLVLESTARWKYRSIILDFGQGWCKMLNAPGLKGHVEIYQLEPFSRGEMALMYGKGDDVMAIEDVSMPWGLTVFEGSAELD